MNTKYDPKKIEPKWQKEWEAKKLFHAKTGSKKKKFYALVEFPYPSGEGLHTGHVRGYTAMDIVARKRRMEGFETLYPIGWDAFGLPTENYAIKTGIHPEKVTKKNTDTFRRQMQSLGFSFDWSREINTTDPEYYRWTQWIFLQLFKKGLAYKAKMEINWCPSCKIGLANEEAVGGVCERCGRATEKKEKEQWMLAITKYADRLDKDLDGVDYVEKIKVGQRNWIGRSEGTVIKFQISDSNLQNNSQNSNGKNSNKYLEVFTTRVDTIFGCTYVVVAPEHGIISNHKSQITNYGKVRAYVDAIKKKTEQERTDATKEKTGVKLEGVEAVNPFTGESVPIYVADYCVGNYGTGAVMAVPAHDERDYAFAKKYGLSIRESVIQQASPRKKEFVSRNGAYGLIFNEKEEVLLQFYNKSNGWYLPGGGLEENESECDGLAREIEEETGYFDFSIEEKIGTIEDNFFSPIRKEERCLIASVYKVILHSQKSHGVRCDEAVQDFGMENPWVSLSEGRERLRDTAIAKGLFEIVKRFPNQKELCFVDDGVLIKSGEFTGLSSEEAREKMTEWLVKKKLGKKQVNYKLRDWVFSRQRYWGEPIPMVFCPACAKATAGEGNSGWVPIPEKDLPLKLPKVESYVPTETGESPLAAMKNWVNTHCPECGGPARRETDTMPNWAGSSWYYLRYADPANVKMLASKKALDYWTPVDWYNGGMEHTTLHLLYSRFWHKFLFDVGVVPTKEPYQKRTSHGLILAEGGVKMSKSKGNVVNPDDIVRRFGADTLRVYEMFMGPFDQDVAWSTESIAGSRRFLEKVWKTQFKINREELRVEDKDTHALLHKTIKKVSEDIEGMRFNTAISALMIFVNEMEKSEYVALATYSTFLVLLSPFAPHIAEELWLCLGGRNFITFEMWPKANPKFLKEESVEIVVQVNGKLRARLRVAVGMEQGEIERLAREEESVKKYLDNKEIRKTISVPDRLVNFVA